MRPAPRITERGMPALLDALGSPWGSDVAVEVVAWPSAEPGPRADRLVRVRWGDDTYAFAADIKSRSTPRAIDQAILDAQRAAAASAEVLPMIIVPYLDDPRLDRLAAEAVSGLDLCGNGIVVVPGRLLLRRSGRPNRYPDSQPAKRAYRGATSIVPRVFLNRPVFDGVGAIRDAIAERGGGVAPSTVSKALARMVEDVLVERDASRIALVQPDALLDRLRDEFRMPAAQAIERVKIEGGLPALFGRLNDPGVPPRLVLSGASSQGRYVAGLRTDEPVAFCECLDKLRDCTGDLWQSSERFADLTIAETTERTVLFDARTDDTGIVHASPLQTYLELITGDKRDRETAGDLRDVILCEVEQARSAQMNS